MADNGTVHIMTQKDSWGSARDALLNLEEQCKIDRTTGEIVLKARVNQGGVIEVWTIVTTKRK